MNFAWPAGFTIADEPVRQMVGRSSQTVDGYFRTNKRPVRDGAELVVGEATHTVGDSPHEHTFLILAEMDPNVQAVAPQPAWLTFEHAGRATRHAPDYAIVVGGQGELVECKGLRSWRDPELRARLTSAARHVSSSGWRYRMALDIDMRDDPRREAAEDLWRRHRPIFHPLHEMAVTDILSKGPEMPIADLLKSVERRMGTAAPSLHQVLSLAANARIFIDLRRPIGVGSLVRFADRSALPDRLIPDRLTTDPLPMDVAA